LEILGSICNVINLTRFGSKVKTLFRLLTDWDRKVYRDYLDYKGERCIAVDPKDEIIPLEASLAYGVAVESFL
jgi:hypothetical protein